MDRVTALIWGLIALGAILAFVIYWNRRLHTLRWIDDLLEEYVQGRMPVGDSVSGREPSPAANFSEDQRSSRKLPPPFSALLTPNGRSKPIPRTRRNWCDWWGI